MTSTSSVGTTIHIRHVNGSDTNGPLWGSIQILEDEMKNRDGSPWTKGKNKWVDVQTILHKFAPLEKPAYFIFCRTNSNEQNLNYNQRSKHDPYKIRTSIPFETGKQYLYLETHGIHRKVDFDHLPEFYKDQDNFIFRAPQGKKCSQHGPFYGYIPYDYAMSCYMSGVKSTTEPTNDLLQVKGMNIMLRNYSDEISDLSYLKRSQSINGHFHCPGIGNIGRQDATAGFTGSAGSNQMDPIYENEPIHKKSRLLGGTVKRRKRKHAKGKTRKR
jgi:hypothetical protein